MNQVSALGRLRGLIVVAAAVASIVVLTLATPPEPPEPPPIDQIRVAPLPVQREAPLEVLVPGDMGRALSPFMAMLEGDGPDDEQASVWNESSTGMGYTAAP